MSAEKAVQTEVVEDRGDVVVETPAPVEVELTDEDLAKIGRAPEKKAEAAEPEKKEVSEKEEVIPDKKPPITIPKARFDEVNNKARARIAALEAANQALRERVVATGTPPDMAVVEAALDAKSDEYGKLVAEGELDKAKLVMQEINKLNRRIALAESSAISNSTAQESRHMDSLETLVGMYKEIFPVFDDANKDTYRQEYVDYVARLQGGFEAAGQSPAEALREAVEVAVTKFGLAAEVEPDKVEDKKDKGADRKAAAIDKALKASGAQPAPLGKVGTDSDKLGMTKIDIDSLTMEEFMAMPESTIKRLRGDLA
jgi:hypothetical protein